jgi:hypothetical protein
MNSAAIRMHRRERVLEGVSLVFVAAAFSAAAAFAFASLWAFLFILFSL